MRERSEFESRRDFWNVRPSLLLCNLCTPHGDMRRKLRAADRSHGLWEPPSLYTSCGADASLHSTLAPASLPSCLALSLSCYCRRRSQCRHISSLRRRVVPRWSYTAHTRAGGCGLAIARRHQTGDSDRCHGSGSNELEHGSVSMQIQRKATTMRGASHVPDYNHYLLCIIIIPGVVPPRVVCRWSRSNGSRHKNKKEACRRECFVQ